MATAKDRSALLALAQQRQNLPPYYNDPQFVEANPRRGLFNNLARLAVMDTGPTNELGDSMRRMGEGYILNENAKSKANYFRAVQQITSDPKMLPDQKINELISLTSFFGNDYGLGVKDIVKLYNDQLKMGNKPWKPGSYEEAVQFEKEKSAMKPASQAQETTALYASRIKQANEAMQSLEAYINNLGGWAIINSKTPDWLNFTKGENYQSYEQAQRNFLNAVLRRESGAVISPSEFAEGRRQYFPQPGDKPAVLAQKKANRDLVMQNFIKAAGKAYVPYAQSSESGGGSFDMSSMSDEELMKIAGVR